MPGARRSNSDATIVIFSSRARSPRRFVVGTGNRLGQVEERDVFALAEILRLKQLGQADELGALAGGIANVCDRALQILLRLGRARHLHDADGESSVPANTQLPT